MALAWQREQSLRCPRCGTAHWQWKEDPDAYVAENERCKGCERIELLQDMNRDHKGSQAGIRVVLVPKQHALVDPKAMAEAHRKATSWQA